MILKVSSAFLLCTFSFRFVKGVALLFGIKDKSLPLFPFAQTRLVGDWHISYGQKRILEKKPLPCYVRNFDELGKTELNHAWLKFTQRFYKKTRNVKYK